MGACCAGPGESTLGTHSPSASDHSPEGVTMMHLTITERGRTGKAIATGVTTALALTAGALPAVSARPAHPMPPAAADRALAAHVSTAPSDLRTPDATDA